MRRIVIEWLNQFLQEARDVTTWDTAAWNLGDLRDTYLAQDEMIVVPRALSDAGAATLLAAAERLRPRVTRRSVLGYKKSGSVSYADVREIAPELDDLYVDPSLIAALSTISGAALLPCPERDLHRCALYYYSEPGDHIGFHFDSSHYKGDRYTVLVGVVNRTEESKLECELFKKMKDRAPEKLSIATDPGLLVFFNGDRLYHSVSKLEKGAERIVLTLEYVTDPDMSPIRRLVSDFKDAVTYFGFSRKRKAT
jgi:hypothetical protein